MTTIICMLFAYYMATVFTLLLEIYRDKDLSDCNIELKFKIISLIIVFIPVINSIASYMYFLNAKQYLRNTENSYRRSYGE